MTPEAQPTGSAGHNDQPPSEREHGGVTPAQTRPQLNRGETAQGTFVPVLPVTYGYARVSRGDSQSLDRQIYECEQAGASRVFTDQLSGGRATESRPGFNDVVSHLRANDILIVVELSRLSRSLSDLMRTVDQLVERGVVVRVLGLGDFDNRSPTSRLLWSILGAVAELERSLIRERTLSGLEQAKRSGVQLGRRPSLNAVGVRTARLMRSSGASVVEVGRALGVSERTIRRVLAAD
jgi:DNA invertase Pin-like site-specific DNA recombinase